jgi:alpha-glucosidase
MYQVYLRSFADGNGDGIGDIGGLRTRLPYLAELGVDGLWVNPWYPSPMVDAGYDVSNYRDIDPVFGTLSEGEKLIVEAHNLGLRIVIDIVPNHCSSAHPWFVEALAAGPRAAARRRFCFRPGRGIDGELPPDDLTSQFGGSAWSRVIEPDGQPGEWYLHLYAPEQPDFNWDHPQVRNEFEDILRFWLDRGVDGFRIDAAKDLVKESAALENSKILSEAVLHHRFNRVHHIYQSWRRIADSYSDDRFFIAELTSLEPKGMALYLYPNELHSAFNFDFLSCPWDANVMRNVIDTTLATNTPVGAPSTWVLSNHDVTRHVTRYGRVDTSFNALDRQYQYQAPCDLIMGQRRARAAALLLLALPGGMYIYQGEELGLWEVEDIPDELRQDPIWSQSHNLDHGRDGCRVPLPWEGKTPPFGFSPAGSSAAAWLPQPADWLEITIEAQRKDPDSVLELYRTALRIRRTETALGTGDMHWLNSPDRVLAFTREPGFTCVANLTGTAITLPENDGVILRSEQWEGDWLPPDTAVWLRTAQSS